MVDIIALYLVGKELREKVENIGLTVSLRDLKVTGEDMYR